MVYLNCELQITLEGEDPNYAVCLDISNKNFFNGVDWE